MLKSLPCHLLWVTLLFVCASCGNDGVVVISKGDFELIEKGGNPVLHQPANQQLWYAPNSGKRSLVWNNMVGVPEIFDGLAVFSGGLSDDRRWKTYPAVLAFSPGGVPVEITEMVTKKYCLAQKIQYAPLAGAFRYRVEPSTNGLIQLHGMKLPEFSPARMESSDVSVSQGELDEWIRQIRKNGTKKNYAGVEFLVPNTGK